MCLKDRTMKATNKHGGQINLLRHNMVAAFLFGGLFISLCSSFNVSVTAVVALRVWFYKEKKGRILL